MKLVAPPVYVLTTQTLDKNAVRRGAGAGPAARAAAFIYVCADACRSACGRENLGESGRSGSSAGQATGARAQVAPSGSSVCPHAVRWPAANPSH